MISNIAHFAMMRLFCCSSLFWTKRCYFFVNQQITHSIYYKKRSEKQKPLDRGVFSANSNKL